jgi:site-specific recombinase XerD
MITFNELGENYLIEEFSGKVDANDFVSMKKNQISQTDYFRVKGIVMDIRKANISVTKKMLRQFFSWLVRNKAILENKSIAILTRTMDQLSFGYLFKEQMARNSIRVQIEQFSTKKEAFMWLNQGNKKIP